MVSASLTLLPETQAALNGAGVADPSIHGLVSEQPPARKGITFTLDCVPTAQARPKFTRKGFAYKGKSQKANERTLEALLAPHVPPEPLAEALELRFTAVFPVPLSAGKRKRADMLAGLIGHTVKPDLDNLAKQLKDAMTRLRFWHDDRQVTRLVCAKIYGERPCWIVAVRSVGWRK